MNQPVLYGEMFFYADAVPWRKKQINSRFYFNQSLFFPPPFFFMKGKKAKLLFLKQKYCSTMKSTVCNALFGIVLKVYNVPLPFSLAAGAILINHTRLLCKLGKGTGGE